MNVTFPPCYVCAGLVVAKIFCRYSKSSRSSNNSQDVFETAEFLPLDLESHLVGPEPKAVNV